MPRNQATRGRTEWSVRGGGESAGGRRRDWIGIRDKACYYGQWSVQERRASTQAGTSTCAAARNPPRTRPRHAKPIPGGCCFEFPRRGASPLRCVPPQPGIRCAPRVSLTDPGGVTSASGCARVSRPGCRMGRCRTGQDAHMGRGCPGPPRSEGPVYLPKTPPRGYAERDRRASWKD